MPDFIGHFIYRTFCIGQNHQVFYTIPYYIHGVHVDFSPLEYLPNHQENHPLPHPFKPQGFPTIQETVDPTWILLLLLLLLSKTYFFIGIIQYFKILWIVLFKKTNCSLLQTKRNEILKILFSTVLSNITTG